MMSATAAATAATPSTQPGILVSISCMTPKRSRNPAKKNVLIILLFVWCWLNGDSLRLTRIVSFLLLAVSIPRTGTESEPLGCPAYNAAKCQSRPHNHGWRLARVGPLRDSGTHRSAKPYGDVGESLAADDKGIQLHFGRASHILNNTSTMATAAATAPPTHAAVRSD